MVIEGFTTGDPGRDEGLIIATWSRVRKRPVKPEEDLFADLQGRWRRPQDTALKM